jgi:hypothetical protein
MNRHSEIATSGPIVVKTSLDSQRLRGRRHDVVVLFRQSAHKRDALSGAKKGHL